MADQPSPSARGPLRLCLRNFRGLRVVDWSPEGVCLIAGPNGSGKTTLIEGMLFLSDAFHSGLSAAVRRQRGADAFRHLRAHDDEPVGLDIHVGDASWLRLDAQAPWRSCRRTVAVGSSTKARRVAYSPQWYLGRDQRGPDPQGRLCLRMAWDAKPSPDLRPLVDVLQGFRCHVGYDLNTLRQGGQGGEDDGSSRLVAGISSSSYATGRRRRDGSSGASTGCWGGSNKRSRVSWKTSSSILPWARSSRPGSIRPASAPDCPCRAPRMGFSSACST